ncbi:MAG: YdcF family protein [Sphingobacteriaceae bacterium]|nr:MAG: YdcF family protein [Sphingobacteriaceae bacterium]
MYFLLSKLLIYFLYPFSWILVLLITSIFIKNIKYKRRLFTASIVLLLIFSNGFLLKQVSNLWDVKPVTLKPDQNYNCAIVLGGYISEYNKNTGFFNGAADRFIQAVKLKETGKTSHLLFTGGNASLTPDGFIEADWLERELQPFHFANGTLLFEKNSRNTFENIRFSKQIILAKHLPPPYLLITSAFHMRRALLVCKKAGLPVTPFPCQLSAEENPISADNFIPAADALSGWNSYLKEMIGYLVTSFKQ